MDGNDPVSQSVDKENSDILNPEAVEERFRVDRRKLEEMIQGTEDVENSAAGKFFQKVVEETGVEIFWPTRLKIGAKSKKDPNIKVCGKTEAVLLAKQKILEILDTKRNKVTLKMDVPYTDHSHIIGKGGSTIQNIMEETECHIHFPDSNRTNVLEKSNQVSVTGQSSGVEKARCKLRSLLPIVVSFEVTAGAFVQSLPDPSSPAIQLILQNYGFIASFHQYRQKRILVTVRGSQNQFARFRQGLHVLMEYLTGNDEFKIPVTLRTDIAAQNHQTVMGPANINIQHLKRTCGVNIAFQSSVISASEILPQLKSAVFISGTFDNVHKAWKQLTGYLPLSLSFNLKEGQDVVSDHITKMMSDFKVNIMMRLKKKENVKTITVQGTEKDSRLLFEVRRQILQLDESEVPVCCDRHAAVLASALYLATMSLTDTSDSDSRKQSHHNSERLKVINEFHTAMGTVNRNVLPVQATTDPKLSSIVSNVLEQLNKSNVDRPLPNYQPFPPNLPPAEFCIPQTACRPMPHIKRTNNASASNSASSKLVPNSKPVGRTAFSMLQPKSINPSNVCNPFFTSDIWSPQTEVMSSWPCNESSNHLQGTSVLSNFSSWPICSDLPISETSMHQCNNDLGWFAESSRNSTLSSFHTQFALNNQSTWDQGSSGISSASSSPRSSSGNNKFFHGLSLDEKTNFSAKPLQNNPVLQISKEKDLNLNSMLGRNDTVPQTKSNIRNNSLLKPDYDEKWSLASRAIQQPLDNEERTPTNVWSGYGFSKSMPDASFRDKLVKNLSNKLNNAEMDKENQKCNIFSEDMMPKKPSSNSGEPVFSCSDCFGTVSKELKLSCGDFNKLPQLFAKLGLEKYTKIFIENEVDLSTFLTLNDADLQELGVTYKARKKMLLAISELAGQFKNTKADMFHAAPGAERKVLLIKLAELTSAQDS